MTPVPITAPALERYLDALYGSPPAGSLVEVRFRIDDGMSHSFHPVDDLDSVAAAVRRHGPARDAYLGVLPRRHRHGGVDALVGHASVIWADCDSADAVGALQAMRIEPSIVVASGTARNLHAYWLLSDPVPIDRIAGANRRLALTLGADLSCAEPARILRPPFPGRNHKHVPPAAVSLIRCDPAARHELDDLLGELGDDHGQAVLPRRLPPRATDDPLLALSPRGYVRQLLHQEVRRDGKVTCPFHPDDTPSLHVYAEPERGWYCYGCRQGGSVYDLAARLFHRDTRGPDFLALRQEVAAALGLVQHETR